MKEIHSIMFSGGRSSGMMALGVIESGLPVDEVLFCNTGLESGETYDFVQAVDRKLLGGRLVCLEFELNGTRPGYRRVSVDRLVRDGSPMEALVRWRRYLPNRRTRFCTEELKVRTSLRYLYDCYGSDCLFHKYIGIRADEQRRAARIRGRNDVVEARVADGKRPLRWTDIAIMPLVSRRVQRHDVLSFWEDMDLGLDFDLSDSAIRVSNCVGCFNNGTNDLIMQAAAYPLHAKQWEKMERAVNEVKGCKAKSFPKDVFALNYLGRRSTAKEKTSWGCHERYTWAMVNEAARRDDLVENLRAEYQGEIEFAGCSDGECSLDI